MNGQNDEKNDTSWLYIAASGKIDPPVETREQALPFEKLRWDDFEKLSYRLAGLESNIESCRSE